MITINKRQKMKKIRPSTHPGIILKEEFTTPMGITQAKLANDINVGIKTISELYNKKRGISPLMALKLSQYFNTSAEFWMNLQNAYDLYITYEKEKSAIESISTNVA
jgi:addiction module HigA family antidote